LSRRCSTGIAQAFPGGTCWNASAIRLRFMRDLGRERRVEEGVRDSGATSEFKVGKGGAAWGPRAMRETLEALGCAGGSLNRLDADDGRNNCDLKAAV
jgi:hypothetical protein